MREKENRGRGEIRKLVRQTEIGLELVFLQVFLIPPQKYVFLRVELLHNSKYPPSVCLSVRLNICSHYGRKVNFQAAIQDRQLNISNEDSLFTLYNKFGPLVCQSKTLYLFMNFCLFLFSFSIKSKYQNIYFYFKQLRYNWNNSPC